MGLSRLAWEAKAEGGGLSSRASFAVVEKAAAFINCNELKRWGKARKERKTCFQPSFACQRFVTQFLLKLELQSLLALQQARWCRERSPSSQTKATFAYILDTKVEWDILQHFTSIKDRYRKLKPYKVPFHAPNSIAKTNIYVRGKKEGGHQGRKKGVVLLLKKSCFSATFVYVLQSCLRRAE